MTEPISIRDNTSTSLELTPEQLQDLGYLAGKTIGELCKRDDDGRSLLIFPDSLNNYGDDIGNNVIINLEGNTITSKNIMGFIGYGRTKLRIHSRFDEGREDFFMHYMLEKVFAVNLMELLHSTDNDQIFDFIIFLFPYFLKKALRQGLYRRYVTSNHNDSHLKGYIDLPRHIRLNNPFSGNVAYRSREFSADNDLSQLIRHAIEFIRKKPFGNGILFRDDETKNFVTEIIQATPSYNLKDRSLIVFKNLRPRMHPYYMEYEPLRFLCLQILKGEELKYGEKEDDVYGVLFDGAWLWEEYLGTLLQKAAYNHPRNKLAEKPIYVFNPKKTPRYPDFWKEGIILDAKYKRYSNKEIHLIDSSDINQVISYMYLKKAHFGGFLVPGEDSKVISEDLLNGYGGKMFILSLGIPKAESSSYQVELKYEGFSKLMKASEEKFIAALEAITK